MRQVIYGTVPSKSNGYKIARNRLLKSDAVNAYEKAFFLQCTKYRNKGIDKPFLFLIDVYYPTVRSDLDGVFKLVLDALQKNGAITNDNLCYRIEARKFIDAQNPRIEFEIREL